MQKNLGWFDSPEHATSVMTSAMASDTQLVNGTASESVGPLVDGMSAMIAGLAVALYFCW
jgi:hypothetical protein